MAPTFMNCDPAVQRPLHPGVVPSTQETRLGAWRAVFDTDPASNEKDGSEAPPLSCRHRLARRIAWQLKTLHDKLECKIEKTGSVALMRSYDTVKEGARSISPSLYSILSLMKS